MAERLVHRRAVKLHVFVPSNRRIWTVVGNRYEYWVNPPDYCTCKDYYFRVRRIMLEQGGGDAMDARCYHLRAVEMAEGSGMVDTVYFDDDEYECFITGLVGMIYAGTIGGS
ncbi:MAG: hypothetical protein NZ517_04085 [Candidatus Nitrosocaldus sp.]|nr:hypothetical protein [Candidatus Nitrosocaldus sp.]MDW7999484.1 hypothetical protein [Candidatus Nitrosocaldus sp.]